MSCVTIAASHCRILDNPVSNFVPCFPQYRFASTSRLQKEAVRPYEARIDRIRLAQHTTNSVYPRNDHRRVIRLAPPREFIHCCKDCADDVTRALRASFVRRLSEPLDAHSSPAGLSASVTPSV